MNDTNDIESLKDRVADNVDLLCENIMLISPRGVEIAKDLDNDIAVEICESLTTSYPKRFRFYVNDDLDNEGRFSIYASYDKPPCPTAARPIGHLIYRPK